MKPTTRYMNNCGRINIPFRLRNQLGITETTKLNVTTDGQRLIIEKVNGDGKHRTV